MRYVTQVAQRDAIGWLHTSLARRETPEAVAEVVLEALDPTSHGPLRDRLNAIAGASTRHIHGWSSMATTFQAPLPMNRHVEKAQALSLALLGGAPLLAGDGDRLEGFVDSFSALIRRPPGAGFRDDRIDRVSRKAMGLSRRRYAKLFRMAGRLERRLARLRDQQAAYRLVLVSKAALAPEIGRQDLGEHLPTAAFVAYLAARMKLRSTYTAEAQQRPFDTNAEALLELCAADPATRWTAIAHVFPRSDVLARVPDDRKLALLARWFDILQEIAARLEQAHARTAIDLDTMIVRRGNDSTTWNIFAGAWNRARDHWIALVQALGLDPLLDDMLPGKVMRLMAADVAALHRATGNDIHPDTRVWRDLPKPWAVLHGEARCTRADVEAACLRHGVDAAASGWTAARPRTAVATFRPTPELVHGVAIGNPYVAGLLKRMHAYSGRPVRMLDLEGDSAA